MKIEDVRIRYFNKTMRKDMLQGFVYALFGEMIKGADSWITVSYLNTKENINNDYYYTYKDSLGKHLQLAKSYQ